MTKFQENLGKALDLAPIEKEERELVPYDYKANPEDDPDVAQAKRNLIEIEQIGREALEDALEVARESEAPRAYEVFAGMLKALADINKDVLEVKKRAKDLHKDDQNKVAGPKEDHSTTNIQNAIFVGTTTDLQRKLKEMNEKTIDHDE